MSVIFTLILKRHDIITDAPTSIYGGNSAHPMAPPSHRRQILSDSADVAVPESADKMALIGGRCAADSDCGAAKGSVCGKQHGRCECGDWMQFDIATQECRGKRETEREGGD